jgi:hypothetical protein
MLQLVRKYKHLLAYVILAGTVAFLLVQFTDQAARLKQTQHSLAVIA